MKQDMLHESPSVSVVIATYNRGEVLADTIEYVLQNDYPAFELVVVDQTKHYSEAVERRLEVLQQAHPHYRHLTISIANPGLARNTGIHNSSGEIIIFCDDDVIMQPDFIANHAKCYRDSTIGGVGGRTLTPSEQASRPVKEGLPGRIGAYGALTARFHQDVQCDIEWGVGCNMSFRRSALLEAGGFDERYTNAALKEEADLFVRVRRKGYRTVFEPTAELVHLRHPTGGCRSDEQFLRRRGSMLRGRSLFAMTHKGQPDLPFLVKLALKGVRPAVRHAAHYERTYGRAKQIGARAKPLKALLLLPAFARLFAAHLGGIKAHYFEEPDQLSVSLAQEQSPPPSESQLPDVALGGRSTQVVPADSPLHARPAQETLPQRATRRNHTAG